MIGIFSPLFPRDHFDALGAFADGLKRHKVEHFITGLETYRECDVAVVFGIGKKGVPASYPRGRILKEQKKRGLPYVILEKGFLRRDEYFHVGWNGLNGNADFRNTNVYDDRWRKLGIPLETHKSPGSHVLVCGQVPWDASVQHSDHVKWCRDTIIELSDLTSREIRFRPHPALRGGFDYGLAGSTRTLEDDLRGAWAVVTFNSNAAVEAAIKGIPVFAMDRGSMAYPIANKHLGQIHKPLLPARKMWASRLAYAQWTLDEIASGKTWRHLNGL